MMRTIVFLVTLMVVLPSDGSAQDVLSPGDRIRITQVDGAIFTGTLAAISAEEVQLSADSSRAVGGITMPRSRIATLERLESTGDKRNLMGIVGLLAGGAVAWATLPEHEDARRENALDNATEDVFRVFIGIAVGGLVGSLIGYAMPTENWVVVPSVDVAPSGQSTSASGFSFGLRVARVGLPW